MVRTLKEAGVTQPDDALLVRRHFGAVMIVGFEWMRFDVSVDQGLWVIGVGLVQVVLRHRRAEEQPRRQDEYDDHTAQPGGHAMIMVFRGYTVKCLGSRV